jgi:hypothetical protein
MGKYNTYTAEFKVEVIKFTEQNGNRAAQWEFIVNEAHIHYWCKQKEMLCKVNEAHIHYWCKQKEMLCKVKGSVRVFWGPKTGKFDELKDKLLKYFKETRNNRNDVLHRMLQLRVREIA